MSNLIFTIISTLVVLAIIAFGLWYFERMLARQSSRVPGLCMPVAFFIISVMSVVQAAGSVFADMQSTGGLGAAVATLIISFVLINLPTLLVYVVYFRTRKKMGERPWPLRNKADNPDDQTHPQ